MCGMCETSNANDTNMLVSRVAFTNCAEHATLYCAAI